jgi:hypothetical protein
MFERNRIDTIEHSGISVEITTRDGDVIGGRLFVPQGRNPADVLNGAGDFVEFQPWGAERAFVAKATIRNLKVVQVPRAESLKGRIAAQDGFDPHAILGVTAGAGLDDVRVAWHRLSKAYHPDRYAAAELPPEVVDYLSSMARRINAAYAALEGPLLLSRKAAALRQAPIYQTGPRG